MSALDKQEGGNHYKGYAIQPVEFITKNKLGFLEGCVIKRLCRWQAKDGIKDLRKAIHEIELLIELTENLNTAPAELSPQQRMFERDQAEAAETIERALKPQDGDYILSSGQTPPASLKDGTVVWEWYATADYQRVGVMHRGQLVRDPVAG